MSSTAAATLPPPTNSLVTALLTDLYQITMTYAHWKIGKHTERAVFELFFRKNPFQGQFTLCFGVEEVVKHLEHFGFSDHDIAYLKSVPALAQVEDGFFEYLRTLDTSNLTVHALPEGTVAFPRIPLVVLEAPLGLGQLLETTLLNLINYPSLIATNAARMVHRAQGLGCVEFGLRRAQGPDGACSASKYSYLGGFVATSNVQAGKEFGIPIAGTHAHAYVQAFTSLDEVADLELTNVKTGKQEPFLSHVLAYRQDGSTNDGELAAFVAYACAFPKSCLCLIDTYDTIKSGLPNFVSVALALDDFGYQAKGVRLDSGDLATLSLECQARFAQVRAETGRPAFDDLTVIASNDINEDFLQELSQISHGMTAFGIGTNLVTCQKQPALGCVYKLVECEGSPRIKISQDLPKVTIPGKKKAYRLFGKDGRPLLDFMTRESEEAPKVGVPIVCRSPFDQQKRCRVTPSKVVPLHSVVFSDDSKLTLRPLPEIRQHTIDQLRGFPEEITRYENPTPYDITVSTDLFQYLHELWESNALMEERN